MTGVTGTNDRYLRAGVAIPIAMKQMEPNLVFTNMIPAIKEDQNAFMYIANETNKSSDAKKKTPPLAEIGGKFPELDYTRPTLTAGLLESNGFSIRLLHNVVKQKIQGANEIMKAYETAGFWLAEWVNNAQVTALTAGATTPTWTPTAVWSGTATPVEDLRLLKYQMRRKGYPYRLTDVFLHTDNFGELEGYLTSMDINSVKQERIYGMPGGTGDTIRIPIAGCNVTALDDGITEGYVLGVDGNRLGAETHYFIDPAFSVAKVSYTTIEDSKEVRKVAPNIGVHFRSYTEDESLDTILQFWVEQKTVVTQPYSILYDNGI